MNKEKTKNIIIAGLVIGLVALTVAYAVMTQTLIINSSAKVVNKDASWNIFFDSNSLSQPIITGNASIDPGKELIVNGSTRLENLEVTLTAPGDSVSYTFDVKNTGSVNAIVDYVSLPDVQNAQYISQTSSAEDIATVKANLRYSLTYDNDSVYGNATPAVGQVLSAGSTKKLKLTIAYDSNASAIPDNTVTVSGLNARIDYKQN